MRSYYSKYSVYRLGLVVISICLIVISLNSCGRRHGGRGGTDEMEDVPYPTVGDIPTEDSVDANLNIETPEEPVVQVSDVKIALPLQSIDITSEFGPREDPVTGKQKVHKGLDLAASSESPLAMLPGIVIAEGFNKVAGNFVTLKHGELTISYCHLSKIYVKKNQKVVPGTKIGVTGDTGKATGEHLHLTCKLGDEYIDPYILIAVIKSATNSEASDVTVNFN